MIFRAVTCFFLLTVALASRASNDWREAWGLESLARWNARPTEEIQKDAEAGDGIAMWMMSIRLFRANEIAEAIKWRKKAAEMGVPQAVTEEARSIAPEDLQKAISLLEKAAATGFPHAKFEIAVLLEAGKVDQNGSQVKADPARAIQLLQEAVAERSVAASFELGLLYSTGVGEPRNEDETPGKLIAFAAENGHEKAMEEMARRSRFGIGSDKDLLSSATWAFRARLALLSRFRGAPPDSMASLLRRESPEEEILNRLSALYEAAFRGSKTALLEVAEMNAAGQHGAANMPRAVALYKIAETLGDASMAAKRKELEEKLTDVEAQALQAELKWMGFRRREP